MPTANRPAVPSRNFLMKRFSNLVAVYYWTVCAYVPASDPEPTPGILARPVPNWQHSRKLVDPAISFIAGIFWGTGCGAAPALSADPLTAFGLCNAVEPEPAQVWYAALRHSLRSRQRR